jgi:HAMP domain-containing protein
MFTFIRRKLAVKLSLFLAGVVVPALVAAALMLLAREAQILRNLAEHECQVVEDLILEKAKAAAIAGASAYGAILDNAVDSEKLTLEEILAPTYDEIQFFDAAHRPLQVERKRFNTKLGDYTDTHGVREIQDRILTSSPDFLFSSGMDRRGYVASSHDKHNKPPKGCPAGASVDSEECQANYKRDREVSRGKGKYTKTEQIVAAGFEGTATDKTLVQPYPRDTGEQAWDVAAPIFVKGKHFGGFRVGVARDRISDRRAALYLARAAHHRNLALGLFVLFGATAVLIIVAIFWLTWRHITPLRHLSTLVNAISTGSSDLSTKIRSDDPSEVGEMARSIERLRQSLHAAIKIVDSKAAQLASQGISTMEPFAPVSQVSG